ncbi:hypothetical protein CXG81DRAFT_10939 [Caulochytrium protostelioides]|uniref:DM2 domain-containing protein n=1 Tax=Caulochytrium protostelioides TaxID=1555241 RepID=A0A4P9WYV2_9FUNG|nr:hypothetical protein CAUPRSCDRAFT_6348 [Caulochytrium protostelioides]RKP02310.1 hypothetical protein CXG81DRAFT_10939 [Caulochytrium protostelioides]|eukprot:RKP02310.1 hypothetical protein CXG81DRAFT_10939 [Caulochytrium protostelioides]
MPGTGPGPAPATPAAAAAAAAAQAAKPRVHRKKPTDRALPRRMAAYVPEAPLYTALQDFEKKLDAVMSRTQLDAMDALPKAGRPSRRRLRVFVSNWAAHQPRAAPMAAAADGSPATAPPALSEMGDPNLVRDVYERETGKIPSWALRVEGRLLEVAAGRRTKAHGPGGAAASPKFSSLIDRMVVQLDRDPAVYPDGATVQWQPTAGAPDCDGFEIKRLGDTDVKCKILLYLRHQPERTKLAPALAALLDIKADTRENVTLALWQYIKGHRLQDEEDKRAVRCNAALAAVLGVPRFELRHLVDVVSPLLLPPDPVVIDYTIRVDRPYTVAKFAYDLDVELDDPQRAQRRRVAFGAGPVAQDLAALDDKMVALVAQLHQAKLKRDFMALFADNPVAFLNQWMASQRCDLDAVLGDTRIHPEDTRHAAFFQTPEMVSAAMQFMRM